MNERTWGSVMDEYNKAEDIAHKYNLDIVTDPEPGIDDWVRLIDVAKVIEKLEQEINNE